MTDPAYDRLMKARAQLQRAAEHWQNDLAYGRGDWAGDRALVLYYAPLTDSLEVWYELPNQKPTLVMKDIPADEFDISKMCAALHRADNRNVSVQEKIDEIDAHNAKVQADLDAKTSDQQEEFKDKMFHGLRVDTGNHVPHTTISQKPDRLAT